MKNFIQPGKSLPFVTSGAVASGALVIAGALKGVATTSAAGTGETIEVALEGVFELAKAAGAITQGANVYWDAANSNVTTTASGNTLIGQAFVAAGGGDTTVQVRLNN